MTFSEQSTSSVMSYSWAKEVAYFVMSSNITTVPVTGIKYLSPQSSLHYKKTVWKICNFHYLMSSATYFLTFYSTSLWTESNVFTGQWICSINCQNLNIISVEPAVIPYSYVNLLLSPLLIFPGAVNKLKSPVSWNDCMSFLKDWNNWQLASVLFCFVVSVPKLWWRPAQMFSHLLWKLSRF